MFYITVITVGFLITGKEEFGKSLMSTEHLFFGFSAVRTKIVTKR
jgi:hypothetical protein